MQKIGFKNWLSLLIASSVGVVMGVIVVMLIFSKTFSLNVLPQAKPDFYGSAKRVNVVSSAEDNITSTRENAIVRAARRVGPAVASISVVQTRVIRTSPSYPFGDQFFDEFWSQFFGSREYKQKLYGLGSGVIINPDGYVLTNQHVVQEADEVKVTLANGDEYSGEVVGQDITSDLALVKIKAKNLPYAPLGNSDDLTIGEWAIALGNPFGYLLDDPNPTVTVGVISALNRDIKRERKQLQVYRNMIQTDAAINPGNSGGPLVNADGEIIGINTFIFTTSRGSEGVGFAVPINRAKGIIGDLVKYGEVRRAWLGIQAQNPNLSLSKGINPNKKGGVLVVGVDQNSPAEKAGLKKGDIITKIGGHNISNLSDWDEVVSLIRAGEKADLTYLRQGKANNTDMTSDTLPTVIAQKFEDEFGMTVTSMTRSLADQLGTGDLNGVIVSQIKQRSQAYYLGLKPGDIIRKIEDIVINNISDYKKAISNTRAGKISMLVEREGELYLVALER